MKNFAAFCCMIALSLTLFGCGEPTAATTQQPDEAVVSASEVAEPQKALEKIYENIDIIGILPAIDSVMEDQFNISPDLLDEYYVNYSSGRYGVADVFILKPAKDQLLNVRELLEQVKLNRIKEFENYDIHNSYQIAQDAEIFEQDDYVIMLMLDDSEAARKIIDQYLPKK
ncbi:DUF4358 domain-containing protein [Oscillospiraceae bacterium PP1C4]